MFKCSGRCIYVKHSDYVVLRGRTSEQLLVGGNGNGNDSPLSDGSASSNAHNKDIMTGQKQPSMLQFLHLLSDFCFGGETRDEKYIQMNVYK